MYQNHFEIKHLKMIYAIAETGTMTRAADLLCVTQSALSQQLKDLEAKLGVEMFVRARRKMILTATGDMVLENARRILETLEDTEREILKRVSGEKGELRVGTQCIFCFKWLPGVMKAFQGKFPDGEVELGHCVDLAMDLESKRYDLVITANPDSSEPFVSQPLFEDRAVCVLPRDHALCVHPYVHLEDFSRFNLISFTDKGADRFYQMALKPKGIHPKRFSTLAHPQAMIEMIAAGFGIAVFPRWAVHSVLEDHGLVERNITRNGLPLTWRAVFLPRRSIPLFYKEFIRIISELDIPGRTV